MPNVTGTIRNPQDASVVSGQVTFRLVGADRFPIAGFIPTLDATVAGISQVNLASGVYTIALPSNDLIVPAGTRWERSHPDTGPAYLYVTPTPATQREEDILADPPASIGSPALSVHAADLALHKGGQELAIAQMTVDQSMTTTTYVDVGGSTITFNAPVGPYVVEAQLPVRCSVSGVIINVSLRLVAGDVNLIDIGDFTAQASNHRTLVKVAVRVPVAQPVHTPAPGSQVSYKLQMRRGSFGAAGTVETFFFNIFEGYVRAYTLGKGP